MGCVGGAWEFGLGVDGFAVKDWDWVWGRGG